VLQSIDITIQKEIALVKDGAPDIAESTSGVFSHVAEAVKNTTELDLIHSILC
jgi:hypothetical protein